VSGAKEPSVTILFQRMPTAEWYEPDPNGSGNTPIQLPLTGEAFGAKRKL